jgi:phospholipid transport system substrate-binding protein
VTILVTVAAPRAAHDGRRPRRIARRLAAPDAQRVTVRCEVEQAGGNPIQLVYAMYLTADGWKVYDVLVDGVSLVTNYRSRFATIIQQQGMDGLIRQLAEKNRRPDHD